MTVTNTEKTYIKIRPNVRKRVTNNTNKRLTYDERWQLIINDVRKLNK